MSERSEGSGLAHLVGSVISVITNDGRHIVGILRGYDQTTNLILQDCHERVYSTKAPVEQIPLGLYLIRGDNIAVIGEQDEDVDAALDFDTIRAPPLKPIGHG